MKNRILSTATFVVAIAAFSSHATKVSHTEDFTTSQFVDVDSTTAWLDTLSGELKMFPFEITSVGTASVTTAYDVFVDGNQLFFTSLTPGFEIFDISDPATPTLIGSYSPGACSGVAVSGDIVVVTRGELGIEVLDITIPASPSREGTFPTGDSAGDVVITWPFAYVTDGLSGLVVVDVSNLGTGTLTGSVPIPGGYAQGVAVQGDYAYVAAEDVFAVIDISDPANLSVAGSLTPTGSADLNDVAVDGDKAYVTGAAGGLRIIDVGNPASPAELVTLPTPGSANGVTLKGSWLYVADGHSGIHAIDVSDPLNPSIVSTFDTSGFADAIVVDGVHAFVADLSGGGRVLQVADPMATPKVRGSYSLPEAYAVDFSDGLAYLVTATGIGVADVSDPALPATVGFAAQSHPPASGNNRLMGIEVEGDAAFVAGGNAGFEIWDVGNPVSPALTSNLPTTQSTLDVAVSGDHAYLADYFAGFRIVDISDLTTPALVGSSLAPNRADAVTLAGRYVFVADDGGTPNQVGLEVFEVTNPGSPALMTSLSFPASAAYDVEVSGNRAYIADFFGSLTIVDITQPKTASFITESLPAQNTGHRLTVE